MSSTENKIIRPPKNAFDLWSALKASALIEKLLKDTKDSDLKKLKFNKTQDLSFLTNDKLDDEAKKARLHTIFAHQYTHTYDALTERTEYLVTMADECAPYPRLTEKLDRLSALTNQYIDAGSRFLTSLTSPASIAEIIAVNAEESAIRSESSNTHTAIRRELVAEKEGLWDIPAETICELDGEIFHVKNNGYRPDPETLKNDHTKLREFHESLAGSPTTSAGEFARYRESLLLGIQCDSLITSLTNQIITIQHKVSGNKARRVIATDRHDAALTDEDIAGLCKLSEKINNSKHDPGTGLFPYERLVSLHTHISAIQVKKKPSASTTTAESLPAPPGRNATLTFNELKWHLGESLLFQTEHELHELHPNPAGFIERKNTEISARKAACMQGLVTVNTDEFNRTRWNIDNFIEAKKREISSEFDRTEPDYYDDQKEQTINDLEELKREIELFKQEIDHAIINHSRLPLEKLELTLSEHPQRKEHIEGLCWTYENEMNIALNETSIGIKLDAVKYMSPRDISQSDFDVEMLFKEKIARTTELCIPESFRRDTPTENRVPLVWINSDGSNDWDRKTIDAALHRLKTDNPNGFIIIHDDSPGLTRQFIPGWAVQNNITQIVCRRDTKRWGSGPKSAASFKNNERIANGNGRLAPIPDHLIMFTTGVEMPNVKLNAIQKAQQYKIPVTTVRCLPEATHDKQHTDNERTIDDNAIE